jgi:hypothetical protein
VSEKLFDSVATGAITIYVGPKIEKYGLDGNSVIHCEPNAKEVIKKIRYLQSITIDEQIKIAQLQYSSLLKSSASWECHDVLRDLASRINKYLASTESFSK